MVINYWKKINFKLFLLFILLMHQFGLIVIRLVQKSIKESVKKIL